MYQNHQQTNEVNPKIHLITDSMVPYTKIVFQLLSIQLMNKKYIFTPFGFKIIVILFF